MSKQRVKVFQNPRICVVALAETLLLNSLIGEKLPLLFFKLGKSQI